MVSLRIARILAGITFCLCLPPAAAAPRELRFNDGWRFLLGNPNGAEGADFADTSWRTLGLPHDWSIEGEFSPRNASATGFLPGGTGWYRKHFTLPEDAKGKRVFLRFEGVSRGSEVWLNGALLGQRPSGYIDFEYDLTAKLRPSGEDNVVAVRVARENVADSRWYPGTGIYRDTWLAVTDPIHVTRHGTFITTPMVDEERAEVNSTCEVRNDSTAAEMVTVTAKVLDAAGKSVGESSGTHEVAAGQTWNFPLYNPVAQPHRWDLDDPYLYRVVHTVSVEGRMTDETSAPLGIRLARFDANRGFFLNERHVVLKGVCIHHDAGNLGAAVPRGVLERRLRLLKGIGVNAIRCSHNPMADDLYGLCDTLGLLVMDEAFDEWEIGKRKWVEGRNVGHADRFGYSHDFARWAVQDTGDMVRRSRQHPCVIMYSIGNEIDYPTDPYVHPRSRQVEEFKDDPRQPSMNRLAAVAPSLIAAVKAQDPTRPVTMALSNISASNTIGLASMLDVVGYNYQEGNYDADHARFPDRIIYGSENGQSPEAWKAVAQRPFVGGQFLWTGFDFLGEADRWPRHGSGAGLFDTAGFPKANAFYREAIWSEKPVLHLRILRGGSAGGPGGRRWQGGPSHWNEVPGENRPAQVIAYTNLEEVTLILNGKPVGTAKPEGGVARWQVPWEKGTLEVSGKTSGGETLKDTLSSTGTPAKLRLQADRAGLAADGREVIHLAVELLDADGRLVTDSDREVTVRVRGDALRLLVLDAGNLSDTTSPKAATRATKQGQVLAILQSTGDAGTATVEVSSPDLPDTEFTLETRK